MNGIVNIQQTFKRGKVFIGYLTAGDGGVQKTLAAACALIDGGVNLLEIGVPFSDPIADGPVIQQAATRALVQGTTLADVLWLSDQIKKYRHIPLVLFSYFNPIYQALKKDFLRQAQLAGIDGILIVDCPLEEMTDLRQQCLQYHLAPIYIITPTTSPVRIRAISRQGEGFLYYACRAGTTGVQTTLPATLTTKLHEIRQLTHLPIAVGFGVSTSVMAEAVLKEADAVVVGSLFVDAVANYKSATELTALARDIIGASS